MSKKVVSIALVLFILIASFSVSASLPEKNVPKFLEKTGTLGYVADNDKSVTRAEFAMLAAKLINISSIENLTDSPTFADVDTSNVAYNSIELLASAKIISGYGDGTFHPDELINYSDACVIIIRIMGYEYMVSNNNYLYTAGVIGVLDGVEYTTEDSLTYINSLKIIYNVLEADVSVYNPHDGSTTDYNQPYMTKRLGIYRLNGKVTDDGITSLSGETKVKEGQIAINNYVFENKTGNTDLLGYNVRAYYRYDDDDALPVLLFAYVNESTSDMVILDSQQIVGYSNNTYRYYHDIEIPVESKISVSRDYTLIFNGHVYKAETAEKGFNLSVEQMMKPETGSVKLIDTDNDGKYDLVMVKYYNDYVVESYDVENLKIYGNPEITPGTVDLKSAEDNIRYYNSSMRETTFDLIHSGYVVSVAKSADGKKAEVIINANNISGVLESSDSSEYVIGGVSYGFSGLYKKYINANSSSLKILPSLGDNCILYVNFQNRILYSSVESKGAAQYGILTDVGYVGNGLRKKVSLEIFTEENNVVIFETADKVKIDGTSYKNSDDIYKYLKVTNDFTADGEFSGLIIYSFNSEKQINYIDTPYYESKGNPNANKENKNTLHVMENGEKQVVRYRNDKQTFSGKFLGRADTLYISMPDAVEDIRKDMVVTTLTDTSSISNANGSLVEVTAFSTDTDSMYADVVVRYLARSKNSLSDNRQYYVVENIADAIDNDGNYVKQLTLTNGKVKKDYLTESSYSLRCKCNSGPCATHPLEVEVGDIIKVCFNKYDQIADGGTFVSYDYSTGLHWAVCTEDVHSGTQTEPIIQPAKASEYTRYSVLKGYLNERDGEAAEFMIYCWPYEENSSFRDRSIKTEMEYNTKKIFSLEDAYVIEVNSSGKQFIKNITTNELKTYNDGLGEMENVMILTYNHAPYLIVVYK